MLIGLISAYAEISAFRGAKKSKTDFLGKPYMNVFCDAV